MKFDFEGLAKLPEEPAAKLLAEANVKLETPLQSPASASVPVVLQELQDEEAVFDMLHLLAVVLPKREAVWWACLAARDLVGQDATKVPPSVLAAEAWVRSPTDENREKAQYAMDTADMDDDTVFCAMAALYSDGTLGVGDLAGMPAPPNGVSAAVVAMNMKSLAGTIDTMEDHVAWLIARALDIARGGNGRVAKPAPEPILED